MADKLAGASPAPTAPSPDRTIRVTTGMQKGIQIVTGTHSECDGMVTITRDEYDALHAQTKAELSAELVVACGEIERLREKLKQRGSGAAPSAPAPTAPSEDLRDALWHACSALRDAMGLTAQYVFCQDECPHTLGEDDPCECGAQAEVKKVEDAYRAALVALRKNPASAPPARSPRLPEAVTRNWDEARAFLAVAQDGDDLTIREGNALQDFMDAMDELTDASGSGPSAPAPTATTPKLAIPSLECERNWPEDFGHENGQYLNGCIKCGLSFVGHKRRVVCKTCSGAASAPTPATTQEPVCWTCGGRVDVIERIVHGQRVPECNACTIKRWDAASVASATAPTTTKAEPPVRVWPENFWRDVWHEQCPARGGRADIMRGYRSETLAIEDGSVLTRFECLGCGANCYAGLDSQRRIVSRPYPATAPTKEESNG